MPTVRAARADEFEQVMDFYTRMIDEMCGTDFDVRWRHGVHPSPEFLRAACKAGEVYVVVADEGGTDAGAAEGANRAGAADGGAADPAVGTGGGTTSGSSSAFAGKPRFAAAMVLNEEGTEGYDAAPWRVSAAPGEAWVVHVLATLPAYHSRGFARTLVQGGIDVARAAGKKAVRLDVFTDNVRAQRLYESCGFEHVGTCSLYHEDLGTVEFALYELAL